MYKSIIRGVTLTAMAVGALALAPATGSTGPAAAADPSHHCPSSQVQANGDVNVRAEPSTTGSYLGTLHENELAPCRLWNVDEGTYTACGGTSTLWVQITWRGGAAYVAQRCVRPVTLAAKAEVPPAVTFQTSNDAFSPYTTITATIDGVKAGTGSWSQDPGGDLNGDGRADPGDAIIAHDTATDGYGVETRLSTGRVATTRGHNAPYWSPWATGDLPEGNTYTMTVCVVQGDFEKCTSTNVTA